MKKPRVSVLLPVYGVERTLAACLDSVLGQSMQNFEVICVDDASPDGCAGILCEYAARDNRIKIITHAANRGLAAARNSGLDHATGECVLFVDTDDVLHRQALVLALGTMMRYEADVVAFRAFRLTEEGRGNLEMPEYESVETEYVSDRPLKAMLDKRVNVFIWNKLYRREVFGDDVRFDVRQRVSQDQGVLPLILLRARRLVQLKNRLYYYFDNPRSLSNDVRPWTITSHTLEGTLFARYRESCPMGPGLRRRFRRYTAKIVFQAAEIVFSRVPADACEEKRLLDLFVDECRGLLDAKALSRSDFCPGRLAILTVLLLSRDYRTARRLWFALRVAQNPFRTVPNPGHIGTRFDPLPVGT